MGNNTPHCPEGKKTIIIENEPIDPCCVDNCTPTTDGKPTNIPGKKDPIRKFDPCACVYWNYHCDTGWQMEKPALCALDDYDPPANPCANVRVPLFDKVRGCCTKGAATLQSFADLVMGCVDFCALLKDSANSGAPSSPGFGGKFTTFNPENCTFTEITLPTETPVPPICTQIGTIPGGPVINPNPVGGGTYPVIDAAACQVRGLRLPIFANARFNNGSASALTPIGAKGILTGIAANRFTQHQNDPNGVFTGTGAGIRVNRTGWYIFVGQIRTNTFDASGLVPAGFHGECDGFFINGAFSGAHPNEEKNAAPAAGSGMTTSAWQIMSHHHIYLNAGDVYAPSASSFTHSVVWSGEVAVTYMGY